MIGPCLKAVRGLDFSCSTLFGDKVFHTVKTYHEDGDLQPDTQLSSARGPGKAVRDGAGPARSPGAEDASRRRARVPPQGTCSLPFPVIDNLRSYTHWEF